MSLLSHYYIIGFEFTMMQSHSQCGTHCDADDAEDDQRPPQLRSAHAICTRYNDGQLCLRPVVYHAPHYCEECLQTGMRGMRMTRPRLPTHVRVAVEPWQLKIGNEVRKKLMRMKQAQSSLTVKLSPVPLDIFKGLHNMLCNLQPADGGRHITPIKQIAGSRGGEKHEHVFEIVSGKLVALFFKPTFVFAYNQGSLLMREEDGTVLAVIAPITFRLKYTLPLNLTDLVLSVTYDVASLPRDGVFRFDEMSVEFSATSKDHMKSYICGELRKMLDGFSALQSPRTLGAAASNLFSPQQMVQIDFFAPTAHARTNATTSDSTHGVGAAA
eukprot:6208032-Pleurochrysis_carterae.AAC.1